jgi:hypothetical protein
MKNSEEEVECRVVKKRKVCNNRDPGLKWRRDVHSLVVSFLIPDLVEVVVDYVPSPWIATAFSFMCIDHGSFEVFPNNDPREKEGAEEFEDPWPLCVQCREEIKWSDHENARMCGNLDCQSVYCFQCSENHMSSQTDQCDNCRGNMRVQQHREEMILKNFGK